MDKIMEQIKFQGNHVGKWKFDICHNHLQSELIAIDHMVYSTKTVMVAWPMQLTALSGLARDS